MGNNGSKIDKLIKQEPFYIQGRNISFGGKEEEEMIQNFNSFDILWYAPENSEKLEEWIAFTNVNVIRIFDEEQFLNLVSMGVLKHLIIIMTGSFAEKIIPKINKSEMILPHIIIYCMNLDYHKKWSEKYEEVSGVFSHPAAIFDKLLKIQNEGYNIPIFNYKIIGIDEFNFNYYDNIKNIDILINQDNFSLFFNKFEKFSINVLRDFILANDKFGRFFDYMISETRNIKRFFYGECAADYDPSIEYLFMKNPSYLKPTTEIIQVFIGLIFVSLYFSKLPYLFGLFNYEEIENILKEEVTITNLKKEFKELHDIHLNKLMGKLNKEEISIMEETEDLQFLHYFLIKFIKIYIKEVLELFGYDEYSKFPILIKYLMDLDFCFKLFFFFIYTFFKTQSYKRICQGLLSEVDKRIIIFQTYCYINKYKEVALKLMNKNDFNTLNNALKIKDFIVIGNKKFHKIIKETENYFSHKLNIPYLSMNQLRDHLTKKKEEEKYRNFNFIFIIDSKEAESKYKELYSIKNDFGLTLSLIIYMKEEKTLINKKPFQLASHLQIFIANNTNEIINYINSQEYLNCGFNFINQSSSILETLENLPFEVNKKLNPRNELINIENSDKLIAEEGIWELADSIPQQIFEKAILGTTSGQITLDKIRISTYNLFRENEIEYLFYERYCKYLSFHLIPELGYNTVNVTIKQFCYTYSLNDGFYYILNNILKSKDPKKITNYLEIISMINNALKDNIIKSYEGEVFRGTRIENDFIENSLKEGNIISNLGFWSSSKDRKIGESFLADKEKNVLFLAKTKKYNIDLDIEKISKFDYEKEVLFLPFTKWLVKGKEKKNFNGKEIYEIKLEALDLENERSKIKALSIPSELIQFIKEI